MESDSEVVLHQLRYAPLDFTPLEKSSTFSTAIVLPSMNFYTSIIPVPSKKPQAPL